VIAHVVAAPVLERVDTLVAGDAPYVELDGFVVVLTGPDVPLLPNAVALTVPPVAGRVRLDGATVWDPTLRIAGDPAALGRSILDALGVPDAPRVGDPAALGARLIGRGPGLTPEGDDFVAGLAAVVAAGPSPARDAWVRELIGSDLRRRTTALSATLLELAAAGMGPEPLQSLLLGRPGSIEQLLGLGHSSGRAYALGAATALVSCL
jgi:hypothetical protein